MKPRFIVEIECEGTVFCDHLGAFSPEPELVSILMGICTGVLTTGLAPRRGRNIPIKDTKGNRVGHARLIESE